jgi:IS4 transposase
LLRVGSNVHLLEKLGYVEREGRDTVYLWPERNWDEPPVVLRLIKRSDGQQTMYLVTDVRDPQRLSEKSAGILYEMRWGVEVFYRSLKQTLEKRRMLSRTPAAARSELTWALFGLWLLGLMTVAALVARGRDPLRWSAAQARDRVRQSMRAALGRRKEDRGLSQDLAHAVKDEYRRGGSKKARNWPHKKKEKPPGSPKIQAPTAEQRRAMKRLKAKEAAP